MALSTEYWVNSSSTDILPDTILFDVDGVLLDDTASFRAAVIATVQYLTNSFGAPLVTIEEVAAFKKAGGLNNDWDLAYTLVALLRGKYQARVWSSDGPSLTQLAEQSDGCGLAWVHEIIPQNALPDYAVVQAVMDEYYWGTDILFERVGKKPHYLTAQRGFVWQEPPLVPAGFLAELESLGVKQFGIITGRNRAELKMGLELLNLTDEFDLLLTAEDTAKPDPKSLSQAVAKLRPKAVLYIGDTRDDLDLVLNYRAHFNSSIVPIMAAIVAPRDQWAFWQNLGADIVLSATNVLPQAIQAICGCGISPT